MSERPKSAHGDKLECPGEASRAGKLSSDVLCNDYLALVHVLGIARNEASVYAHGWLRDWLIARALNVWGQLSEKERATIDVRFQPNCEEGP